ncbi:DUF4870 domain-containing protein [Pseudomonas syringae]|uniref:DUF4870 domain-containing protein n=1 Tax=Pseudomonas syringae TaxID=317 RepID=UPI003F756E18
MSDSQPPIHQPGQTACQWAMLCHLSALLGMLFPFGNLLGPLILWQMKKKVDPFIDSQGKEALNFQITVSIATIVCIFLMGLVGFWFGQLVLGGLYRVLPFVALALAVIAAVKAYKGVSFRYPLTWRPIK